MRHFRSLLDLTPNETESLIELALRLKQQRTMGLEQTQLSGRVLGLLFEKPSMRTRVSFESAFAHLGGSSIFLTGDQVGLGKRESIEDFGRIVSTYIDLLAVRTFSHAVVVELARHSSCPVINALSDELHPCQALADLCTIKEHFGSLAGIKMVFVGDGNNVARSLAHAAVYTGIEFVLCSPPDYSVDKPFLDDCSRAANIGTVRVDPDIRNAVRDADVIYTDVWSSMGQEAEQTVRKQVFSPYQVTAEVMRLAKPTARFLHCLPAHRGEEVAAEVIDGPQSDVVVQAANRLHAQKALMLWLLTEAK